MKPLLISSGEPAGIGPDICLALASKGLPVVVLADKNMLHERAKMLNLAIELKDYKKDKMTFEKNTLTVYPIDCKTAVKAGQLNPANSAYVLSMLSKAANLCLNKEFTALVTAPIHKAIIAETGLAFSGHTEFLADFFKLKTVVMLLASPEMKMALITTHLPLKAVAETITTKLIVERIQQIDASLKKDFAIAKPAIYVAGLNPHAGENGYLGLEEIETIQPALALLKSQGIDVHGPFPADTLFTEKYRTKADTFVAMYHDQGLPVLKYSSFGQAVNISLGLPIIRTSVDHGTALELAGTGKANASSLFAAVNMAKSIAKNREAHAKN